MSRQCPLLTISFDLKLYLLSFLDPPDILHLRMTCTALQHATLQKIVWIEAVRRMCIASGVFRPTFPLCDMSLDELEYAAVAPHKWLAASGTECASETLPASSFCLDALMSYGEMDVDSTMTMEDGSEEEAEADEHDLDIHSLFLVPGGRFLIGFSWRWIRMWDLGYPRLGAPGSFSKLIAKQKVDLHSMYLVHSTPDGLGLRILVSCPIRDHDNPPEMINVYEIYPDQPNPQLIKVGSLEVPFDGDAPSFYSISGNRLYFLQGTVFKIWDFITDEWVSWVVEGEFSQCIIAPDFIILLHKDGASLWPNPPLISTSLPFSTLDQDPVPPLFNMPYKTPREPGGEQLAGPCDWYSGTSLPMFYDIVVGASPSMTYLYRYEIVVAPGLGAAELIEHPPMGVAARTAQTPLEVAPYRFCNDALVALWVEPDTGATRVHTSPMRPRAATFTQPAQTVIATPTPVMSSFCPVSGRYVWLDNETTQNVDGVLVLDMIDATADALAPAGFQRSQSPSPSLSPREVVQSQHTLPRWNAAYSNTQF